jgi:hypothetical protein
MAANTTILEARYDHDRCRHVADGQTLVLHCHHFAILTTQLANDCALLDAKKLLAQCAEDAFYPVLANYYRKRDIRELRERVGVAERYYAEAGLGALRVKSAGQCFGEVELAYSHVDAGWLKRWGKADQPVNHIGCGYVTALFSALYDRQRRAYAARERQSIALGAKLSVITVTDAVDLA